jgi:hypothetical protein
MVLCSNDPTDIGNVRIRHVSHVERAFKAAYSCCSYFYEQFIFITSPEENKTAIGSDEYLLSPAVVQP